MSFLNTFIVSLLVTVVLTQEQCHHNWVSYSGHCYGYGKDTVNFADAAELCEVYRAKLVEIETQEENAFIKQWMKNISLSEAWIGGTDIFDEGKFEWISTGLALEFTDWGPGQPDDSGPSDIEDCMTMWDNQGYHWNDVMCETEIGFLCEAEFYGEAIIG